ncbi:unnamed protein product [Ceutorhynchus assimilis]|uniref:V-SNARE coiled-coil homology domain-containing protein n=1 Tax=Ceutorhynchus assimilis TaxID=467358 RepID=A0A9N9MU97_9CUCU|nr:unnamed protein product [Ceutorhynchus assimilis]
MKVVTMDQNQSQTPPKSESKLSTKLQQTQQQVDEVTEIMKINVQQVIERGSKISEMDERTKHLAECSKMFEKTGKRLDRKMWWKDMKMRIILATVGVVLLTIIIISPKRSGDQFLEFGAVCTSLDKGWINLDEVCKTLDKSGYCLEESGNLLKHLEKARNLLERVGKILEKVPKDLGIIFQNPDQSVQVWINLDEVWKILESSE